MNIVLFVPRVHFHASFVIRALALRPDLGDHRYLAVTTPKISNEPAPFLRKLLRLFRDAGPDYVLAMAAARARHLAAENIQRLLRIPLDRRTSLSVGEALRVIGARVLPVRSVRQPAVEAEIASFRPDLACAVFFNQMVPAALRGLPRLGAINLHPSWLPLYRGISPCFWVLARGELETGVSIHRMTEAIDRGPILAQSRVPIESADTLQSLYRRCALRGGELLADLISDPGRLSARAAEPEAEGSYFSAITAGAVREFRAHGRKFF